MGPHRLRLAWEARDPEAVAACFTVDGQFHSPVIGAQLGIEGQPAIAELMRVVFDTTADTEFTHELSDSQQAVLGFRTKFNGRPVRGLIWLDLTPNGQVRELWAFARPLTAVVAVGAAIGPGLTSREHRALGVLTRMGFMPLVAMAWLVDRIGSLLIRRLNRVSG